jgi:D-aspartate ligase
MMNRNYRTYSDDVGSVVIGGDFQGLGVVRSLGHHQIPVGVIDDELSISRFSRYASFSVKVSTFGDASKTVEILLDLARMRGLQGWVLYPTRDETVAAISQNKEELEKFYRVPTPDWNTIKHLWDKRNTYDLAKRLGIPIPRMCQVADIKELNDLELTFPVVIKPAIKEHFVYATAVKAWRANNRPQLKEFFDRASRFMPIDELLIQDLIPGDGGSQYSYCSFFKHGQAILSLVACRRRQHPVEFGKSSTYVESIELPQLEEHSERFLRAIDYYGLVELEYKYDSRNGQYCLLDVNGRTWGYHTIGRRAGVDFPYLLFSDQLSKPVERSRGRAGVRWIRLITDLPVGLISILQGKVQTGAYIRSLREFDEEAVFSRDDPMPALAEIALIPYLAIKRGF